MSESVPVFTVTIHKTNTAPLHFDKVSRVEMTALGVVVTHRWLDHDGDTRENTVSVRRHVIEQVVIVNQAEHSASSAQRADDDG